MGGIYYNKTVNCDFVSSLFFCLFAMNDITTPPFVEQVDPKGYEIQIDSSSTQVSVVSVLLATRVLHDVSFSKRAAHALVCEHFSLISTIGSTKSASSSATSASSTSCSTTCCSSSAMIVPAVRSPMY